MTRREFPRTSFDTINVTPLIDTLFFLLIIFMVTAPLLEYSVEVEPPVMKTTPITTNDPDKSKMINVKADGTILFDKRAVTLMELMSALEAFRNDPEIRIYLRGDRDLKYGQVIDVLNQLRAGGFPDINLVTTEGD